MYLEATLPQLANCVLKWDESWAGQDFDEGYSTDSIKVG